MAKSLAEQVALLSEEERDAVLSGFDLENLQYDFDFWGRPEQQLPPAGTWDIFLILAGRGFGKSRASSEAIKKIVRESPTPLRLGMFARTAADVRDIVVEGDAGILAVSPPSERPEWQPSKRRLTWPNGTTAVCMTTEEADAARGLTLDLAFCDEFAAWRQIPDEVGMTAWDNIRIAVRRGDNPRIMITTTPKRVKPLRELLKEAETNPRIVVRRGSTMDNASNLPDTYIKGITGVYVGTSVERQEIFGEMLEDAEGALWSEEGIEDHRTGTYDFATPLRVVGVDPTVADRPGDECGIVVCGASNTLPLYRREAWVLEDASIKGSPDVWAQRVVDTARQWSAPVVAEINQGGAMVRNAIHQIDPTIKVYEVHSMHGKKLRAEPIALVYEQGRVHHYGVHADLETQMTQWIPGVGGSPDRVDALVHAMTALLIKPPLGFGGGPIRAQSKGIVQARVPTARGLVRSGRGRRGGGGRVFGPK